MDKSDHYDYQCHGCGIDLEIHARKKRGRDILKDPTHCPYCGNILKKKKEVILTGGLMTQEEVSKSMAESWKEAVAYCGKKKRKKRR